MLRTAVGFNPGRSLLKGLRGTSGYGAAMQSASQLGMDAAKQNAGLQIQGLEAESQKRQKAASNSAQKQMAGMQRSEQSKNIDHKKYMSDVQNRMGYKKLNKRKNMNKKQTVLNQLAQE